MSEIIFSILPYAAALVAGIGALIMAFMRGKDSARNEQAKKERQAIDKAHEVRNETNKIPDADLDDALSKWVRNKR